MTPSIALRLAADVLGKLQGQRKHPDYRMVQNDLHRIADVVMEAWERGKREQKQEDQMKGRFAK